MRVICKTEEQLFSCAQGYANTFFGNETLLLSGPLGVGKTFFVKGLCSIWGLDPDDIISPTFHICCEYQVSHKIFHCDLYRLSDPQEFILIGGLEYFKNGICLIEWPDLIKDFWPHDVRHIHFSFLDNDVRLLLFSD